MKTTLDIDYINSIDIKGMADAGERIYEELYKADFEVRFPRQVVAIDIESKRAFVGRTSLDAGEQARRIFPDNLLYFLRVGAPALYVRR
jgi:hypothetical protein